MKHRLLPIIFISLAILVLVASLVYSNSQPFEKKLLEQSKSNLQLFSELTTGKIVKENYSMSSDCYYGEAVRFYAIPKVDTSSICQQLENTLKNSNYQIAKNYCSETRYKYDTVKELNAIENSPKGVAINDQKDRKIIEVKVQNLELDNKQSSLIPYMSQNKAFWQDKTLVAVYSKIYTKPSYYNGSWASQHKGKCRYKDYDMVKNTITESES